MSAWNQDPERAESCGHTYRNVKFLLVCLLIVSCVLSEPLLWNSEAYAQDLFDLPVNAVAVNRPTFRKNMKPQFFVNRHDDMKVRSDRTERSFAFPAFQSCVVLAQSVSPPRSSGGTVAALSGHAPIRLTVLALAQGDSASASAPSTNPPSGGSVPAVKKKSNKLIWIAVVAGGAAAALALTMKKSPATSGTESVSMTPTGPTITLGTPTVGGQ